MKMMVNAIIRRELKRQQPLLPFSLRITRRSLSSSSNIYPQSNVTGTPSTSTSENIREHETTTVKQVKPTPIEENPYYSKYSEKIKKIHQNSKPEQTQKSLEFNRLSTETTSVSKSIEHLEESLSSKAADEKRKEAVSRRKSLNDIVHVDRLSQLSQEDITQVWTRYHEKKDNVIFAIIPREEYDRQFSLASQYPLFLFPLPKTSLPSTPESVTESGYQLFLSRFKDHSFFLTPLSHFQAGGGTAVPVVVINHFPELSSSKGVVLMNGDFDPQIINLIEVQCLANEIKLFYSGKDVRKSRLLHTFNEEPDKFDYKQVIQEIEAGLTV